MLSPSAHVALKVPRVSLLEESGLQEDQATKEKIGCVVNLGVDELPQGGHVDELFFVSKRGHIIGPDDDGMDVVMSADLLRKSA